jgi:hypothetical protein
MRLSGPLLTAIAILSSEYAQYITVAHASLLKGTKRFDQNSVIEAASDMTSNRTLKTNTRQGSASPSPIQSNIASEDPEIMSDAPSQSPYTLLSEFPSESPTLLSANPTTTQISPPPTNVITDGDEESIFEKNVIILDS